mmetsp:Transcript_21301/g.31709  ORF Transcript_21301/g.31709 Transcript_21301/m.31709 type:complete len:127 (-) Transcript_21301:286-666(-)
MDARERRGVELFAKLTGSGIDTTRKGQCRKCGGDGHLEFQCRNFLQTKTEDKEDISSTSSESEDNGIMPNISRMISVSSDSEDDESAEEEKRRRKKKREKTNLCGDIYPVRIRKHIEEQFTTLSSG